MSTAIKKSIQYGQHMLTLETGEIARQAGAMGAADIVRWTQAQLHHLNRASTS